MRKLFCVCAGLLLVGMAAPARAAVVPFTGTLSIQIGTLPAVPASGSGMATVQTTAGGLVTQLEIAGSAFATALTAAVPNVFPIVQIALRGTGGPNSLSLVNAPINLAVGATCTGNHPNVSCPGGGLAGFAGLQGTALVGIFFTQQHTPGSAIVTGTLPQANLVVPLTVVGGGSTTMAAAGGINVTVSGAGWTTGMAYIFNSTATAMRTFGHNPGVPPMSASLPLVSTQTGTTETITGSNAVTSMGNVVSLVSPVQLFDNAQNSFTNTVARLTVRLAPEPTAGVLLLAGAGVVSALYGARRLRARR